MATFQAASLQDILSIGGSHFAAEAVYPIVSPIVRLIGALHRSNILPKQTSRIIA
jgi:hypothetical protein